MNPRTISGYTGLYRLSDHARERIAERFGVAGEAEALLWVLAQMRGARQLSCELWRPYTTAPRILWLCDDGVRVVTDGNDILTCYSEGDPVEEGAA